MEGGLSSIGANELLEVISDDISCWLFLYCNVFPEELPY